VENLKLSEKHRHQIQRFFSFLSIQPPKITHSDLYAKEMATYLSFLFRKTGLIFLEPYLLRPLAKTFFHSEIKHQEAIQQTIKQGANRLLARSKTPSFLSLNATNLFYIDEYKTRRHITKKGRFFAIKDALFTQDEIDEKIETNPHCFSTDAKARVLLQSFLLPTMAYVAGPCEREYISQLNEYFSFYNLPMPKIVPRLSVTMIPPYLKELVDKLNIDLQHIPSTWSDHFSEIRSQLEISKK